MSEGLWSRNFSLFFAARGVRVVVQAVMAGLFFTGHIVVWQICLLSAVNGICAALFQPGLPALIPRIAADVQGANGVIRTIESLMTMAGPAVAGALVGFSKQAGFSSRTPPRIWPVPSA